MQNVQDMKALVVYESFFGNTESIARAVAAGLRLEGVAATALDVADAIDLGVDVDPDEYDLVVVGGPTHAFALSRPATRQDAMARGGDSRYESRGLREWLSALPSGRKTRLVAVFDTRVSKVRRLPASAARSAAHILRQRGFTLLDRPTGFVVEDVEGPLGQREMERAIAWGRSIAQQAQARIEARRDRRWRQGS